MHVAALTAGRRRDHELAIFEAWHVAALSRLDQLPALSELIEGVARDSTEEEQSPEAQMAVARVIAALNGA